MQDRTKHKGGRPRQYDPEEALAQVLQIFWQKGFANSSLDELARAAHMNRPSLQAAFGDKKALYLAAILKFQALMAERLGAALAAEKLEDALKGAFQAAIALYVGEAPLQRGCFIVCTAATEAPSDPDIRQALGAALQALDQSSQPRLRTAQAVGELAADADIAALGQLLGACLHSLAIRARAGESRQNLEQLSRKMIKALLAAGR